MADTNDIAAQLEAMRKQMQEFEQSIAPLQNQRNALDQQERTAYEAYQQAVIKAREAKRGLDEQLFDARRKINEMTSTMHSLESQLDEQRKREEAERKAEELRMEFLMLEEKWDKLTTGAPWREWAKDHQISAGHKITADQKVILADPMGLGKTLSAIITCDIAQAATKHASPKEPFLGETQTQRRYVQGTYNDAGDFIPGHYVDEEVIVGGVEKPSGRKILYICPAPLLRNVEREWRMWAKHRSVVILGGMTKAQQDFWFDMIAPESAEFVVIINFEAWRKNLKLLDKLADLEFDTVIIDEAHNAKDTKSIAFRGIKQILDTMQPPYVIPMTGTPVLNRPQELFALLRMVNPQQFHTLNDFLWRYCEQDRDTGYWRWKSGGLDLLMKKISKNIMRRTKDQAGIDLPEKTITYHELEVDTDLYPNQAKVRSQMAKYMTIMIDEKEGKGIAAAAKIAMFTRLRQIETWPAGIQVVDPITKEVTLKVDVEESQKIDYIIRYNTETKEFDGLIPEIIEDERVVLFSQFKAPLRELKDRVERMGKRAVILDGETPDSLKQEIMVDFDNRHTPDRANAKWDIVLANYRVGGVGMNLTAATQMIILDEEWNPGKRDQAYDRIHRIGQDKPVTIHVVRNLKTIDDWLAGIIEHKESVVSGLETRMIEDSEFRQFLKGMEDEGLI